MTYVCPACQRVFLQAGFCPYDGKPLVTSDDHPTLPSGSVPAQRAPSDAGTIETRPSDRTTQRGSDVLPAQRAPSDANTGVRAVSATSGVDEEVKAALRERVGEYDHLIGETLDGRYIVQRKLGEGGMGVVFAVKHAIIERPLAIKVLKREATREASTVRRFVQEAKAASRIGHPNIVDVTDFGATPDGLTYSVMELVDGPTLKQIIRDAAPFPAARAVHIAAQLARALGAAHDKGIVHRDLKPENVFLIDRDGRPDFVKIVDFGIAKVQPLDGSGPAPRLTRTGAVIGTPEYMAPEQASGRSDTDHRVDIYALGTMLYEMLVGRVPHKDRSLVRVIAMQMLDPVTPPSQVRPDVAIAPELEALVMKALAKNRDDRYASMAELYAALEAVLPSIEGTAVAAPAGDSPANAPTTVSAAPRRARPSTRQLHEPEFVAGPLTLPPPLDDEPPPIATPARWPLLVGVVVLALVGSGVLVFTSTRGHGDHVALASDARATAPGDAETSVVFDDAAAVIDLLPDAATSPRDAGVHVVGILRDGGAEIIGPHPATLTIEVLTRPGEANVYINGHFRGPSGTHVSEPYGTRLTVVCKSPHYKGSKAVVFDGSVSSILCTATRLPFCVEGLHNPIDDCEPATPGPVTKPNGSGAGGPVMSPDQLLSPTP